jgi:hypothetical protein
MNIRPIRPKPIPRAPVERAYRPTRAEQETVLRWDREADQVDVWSASPVTWRRCERLGIPATRETKWSGGAVAGRAYRIPLDRFRWGLRRVAAKVPGRRVAVRSAA